MKFRPTLLAVLLAFALALMVGCSSGQSDAGQTDVEPTTEETTKVEVPEETEVPDEGEDADDEDEDDDDEDDRKPKVVEQLNGVDVIAAPNEVPTAADLLPEDQWGNLFPTMGEEVLASAQRAFTELPVKAYAAYMGMGGTRPVRFDDPGQITALFNALASANVNLEEEEMVWTDDYTSFWFIFADGEEFGIYMDTIAVNPPDDDDPYAYYPVKGNADFGAFCGIAHDSYENMGRHM